MTVWKNSWLDACRALQRRPFASLIAYGGLSLALAVVLLVAMLVHRQAAVAPHIPQPERVVVLDFKGNVPELKLTAWFLGSPLFFGPALKARGAPLDLISRSASEKLPLRLPNGQVKGIATLLADPDLEPLLGLEAIAGDLRVTLTERNAVAITRQLALQLWGQVDVAQVLGRVLPIADKSGRQLVVRAIVPPLDERSSLSSAEVIAGFESQANAWSQFDREGIYSINGRVYARLRPGVEASEIAEWMNQAFLAHPGYQELPAQWREGGQPVAFFRALPLPQMGFEGEVNEARWQRLKALAAASGFLLLLALINCANLLAAQLLQRRRETALRQSLGATRAQLLAQWMLEAALPTVLALGWAWLMAWFLIPVLANWAGVWLPSRPPWPINLALACLGLVLPPALCVGPGLLALRQALAPALQGRTPSEGPWGRRLRQGLLALQLSGALLLLVLAGVLAGQYHHLLSLDRGYQVEGRLVLGLPSAPEDLAQALPLIKALQQHPAVTHWAFSDTMPAEGGYMSFLSYAANQAKAKTLRESLVSAGFFETYGMRVLAGEIRHGGLGEAGGVLDAHAARQLGFATPQAAVGALIRRGNVGAVDQGESIRVLAVVADVKLETGGSALPQAFRLDETPQGSLSLYGQNLAALQTVLDEAWARFNLPWERYSRTAAEQRAENYLQEKRLTSLLSLVSALALIVSGLGAYALVADALHRRRTELILHRLHGASDAALALQIAREFAAPLGVAIGVAMPLSAWLGHRYLVGFVDRVPLLPGLGLPMLAALTFTLLVLLLAALRHLLLALALQPVEALN